MYTITEIHVHASHTSRPNLSWDHRISDSDLQCVIAQKVCAAFRVGISLRPSRKLMLAPKSPKSKPSPLTLATSWSASCGPSTAEATSATLQGKQYGRSVLARSKTNPPGAWDGRVRLYNENLAAGPWKPSPLLSAHVPPTSTSKKGPGLTSEDPPAEEKFKCHVQVVFGMRDIALDPRMCFEGIERYFAGSTLSEGISSLKSSANTEGDVVVLPESGHWSPLDPKGREALENLLERLVGSLYGR